MDIAEVFAPDSWVTITERIERKDYPSDEEIAKRLRGSRPIPPIARNYIADRITGKIKLPRGPRPERWKPRAIGCSVRIRRWHRAYKWMKKRNWRVATAGTPYEMALEQVSNESNVSVKTLKKWLRHTGI